MGLSLHVFGSDPGDDEGPEEFADCNVGHCRDFHCFRDTIARHLGPRSYPTLMQHPDCDGEWSPAMIPLLERELREIGITFRKLPPEEPSGAFEHTAEDRAGSGSLYECFHDVDGENLFESLLRLCAAAREHQRPITFM